MPSPLGVPKYVPTGRNNMLASIAYYLENNLPGVTSDNTQYKVKTGGQYMEASDFPCITMVDFGAPELGAWAFDDYVGRDSGTGAMVHGKKNQTMIEINCWDDLEQTNAAIQHIWDMADQLEYLFYYASGGQMDDNNVPIMPNIVLYDFLSSPPYFDTGSRISAMMEKDAMWIPSYLDADEVKPNLKRVSIKVRIQWDWRRPLVTSQ